MTKLLWALPNNAADMKKFRELSEELESSSEIPIQYQYLPDIQDSTIKQLFVPNKNWQDNDYLCVTPVPSCGLLHTVVYHSLYKKVTFSEKPLAPLFFKKIIQPNIAARANHGESLLNQNGDVRLHRKWLKAYSIDKRDSQNFEYRGNHVEFTAEVERMNISGGMISIIFPALTAIGGLVHVIEREIKESIEFAIGYKDITSDDINVSSIAFNTKRKKTGYPSNFYLKPSFNTESVSAKKASVVLLLRCQNTEKYPQIISALKKVHRIAGGDVIKSSATEKFDYDEPTIATYLTDCSDKLPEKSDCTFKSALEIFGKYTTWDDKKHKWIQHQDDPGYTLNMNGYAYLEDPVFREKARSDFPHCWTEPVFSLIDQGLLTEKSWWKKSFNQWGMAWRGTHIK